MAARGRAVITVVLVLCVCAASADPEFPYNVRFNNSYVEHFSSYGNSFYSFTTPTKVSDPLLIDINKDVADLLGIGLELKQKYAEYLSGNKPIPGLDPAAMAYAGHQFGGFTPQLGDGRALLLGEIYNNGENWALHSKGTGPTPYSRGGDGRAVLRSSIREYLCGEALHHLGIPATRSLSIVGSTLPVYRETLETAAVVIRVAPISAFVRFGTFELFSSRGHHLHVQRLADYVISMSFPHLKGLKDASERYSALLREVAAKTGELVAKWMAFGFAHGVLNTDNMSILSMTIDFGPFGFMDTYVPDFIPNHSDDEGRYAFDQQEKIGKWNLERLVDAFSGIMNTGEVKSQVIAIYENTFRTSYGDIMRAKLGLRTTKTGDESLWRELLRLMQGRADYTIFFRKLGGFTAQTNHTLSHACSLRFVGLRDPGFGGSNCELFRMVARTAREGEQFSSWALKYSERLLVEGSQDATRKIGMDKANPKFILRNYMAHVAIENAKRNDFKEISTLLALLQHPFDEQPEMEMYAAPAPDWSQQLELSCSS